MMKTVYGWVVDWGEGAPVHKRLEINLFFSSKEAFDKCYKYTHNYQLIPIEVAEDFNHLDFIPDTY